MSVHFVRDLRLAGIEKWTSYKIEKKTQLKVKA